MPEWFRRFGDIPGVEYTTPAEIDRTRLPGYNDVRRIHEARPRLRLEEWLEWPADDGRSAGSASPAHSHAFTRSPDPREDPAAAVLRNVAEGLELPGMPSDYHFLIQHCVDEFWPRRRKEPDLVTDIERLCWLDIALVQARPDAVSIVRSGETRFYAIKAFSVLIELYEGRGDKAKALEVAEVATRFNQCEDDRERLRWQAGARDTEPVPAPNETTPQHPNGARPNQPPRRDGRISDWGFRPGVPDGPFGGQWSYWWDDWCQNRFDKLWTNEADLVADDLADKYWFFWPWLIGKALITRAPATYERILTLPRTRSGRAPRTYPRTRTPSPA